MKRLLLPLAIAVLLAGCSSTPRVLTDLSMQLPPRQTDSMMIYDQAWDVPETAQTIGTVKVLDGGMTPSYKCLYTQMLALAVNKTIESGGNGLRIDRHKRPGVGGSTCHRVYGTMLLLPDSLVTNDAHTSIGRLEAGKDQELLEMAKTSINRLERMKDNPHNIVKVSLGPSWITSEFETPHKTYKSKSGLDFGVDYQHLWRSGFGVGINYVHNSTSYDNDIDLNLWYLGPSIVASMKLGDKWRWDVAYGLGYSHYYEQGLGYTYTEGDLGVMAQIGIEYMVSKKMGVGLQWDAFSIRMDKPDGYELDNNEFYGIKRMNLEVGLRYYF